MRYLFTILFVWLSFNTAYTQYCGRVSYSSKDGIAQPHNTSLMDSDGILWVSSRGSGINFFDGKSWSQKTSEDGLLFDWAYPMFEDQEGGIWFRHPYEEGASRFINGQFVQYVMPKADINSLKNGQQWFPFISHHTQMYYNEVKNIPVAYIQDSSKQFFVYEFDYQSQTFPKKGKAVLSETQLKTYAPLMSFNNLHHTWIELDNQGNPFVRIKNKNKNETILVGKYGQSTIPIALQYFNLRHAFIYFKNETLCYFYNEEGKLWQVEDGEKKLIRPPSLPRYGESYGNFDLKFNRFYRDPIANSADNLYSIWEIVEDTTDVQFKIFKNSYILAEHNPISYEIEKTILFEEKNIIGIGNIEKDKSGTYWYTNGNQVVRLYPNQMIVKTGFNKMPNEAWTVAQSPDGHLYFAAYGASDESGVYGFDGLQVQKISKLNQYKNILNSSTVDEDGFLYFINARYGVKPEATATINGVLKFDNKGNHELLCPQQLGFFIGRDNDKQLLWGTENKGLWILPNDKTGVDCDDWIKIDSKKGLQLDNVVTALQDQHGQYWMGRGSQGLAVYNPKIDTVFNWVKNDTSKGIRTQSMATDSRGNLWWGTNKGLLFYENNKLIDDDSDISALAKKVALEYTGTSQIQVCKLYDENTLIIGNGNGYYLLDLEAWYSQPRQLLIHSVTSEFGHKGAGVIQSGVWVDNNKDIWLMCSNGMVRYTPKLMQLDDAKPIVKIDKLTVGGESYTKLDEGIHLNHFDRFIKIEFSSPPSTSLNDNIRYRYRLSEEGGWSALDNKTFVNLPSLAADDYIFQVIAEKNGLQSEPAVVKFYLPLVFYKRFLFWIPVALISLSVLYLLFRWSRKKNNEIYSQNLELEKSKVAIANMGKEKERLQVATIVNQLNPHFINNALQWLQIRLDNKNDDEAVTLVGKLSKNISTVFKNSRDKKAYHSLASECNLVKNYLYIQQKRFQNDLEYEMPDVKILEKLPNINIPLLMVQIHVENAVEHGIRNKVNGGKVSIYCKEDPDYFYIFVQDNGIGRAAAKKIGSQGTQNGTKMLRELQNIYNKQNALKINQFYEDNIYIDDTGIGFGTRVTLKIPKVYNYNL